MWFNQGPLVQPGSMWFNQGPWVNSLKKDEVKKTHPVALNLNDANPQKIAGYINTPTIAICAWVKLLI